MSDTQWTLWVIHATDGKRSELTHVYATDEAHARVRAGTWIQAHPDLTEITFRAYPDGFQFVRRRLPGTITVEVMEGEHCTFPNEGV